MSNSVLLVLEDGKVTGEGVLYSIELARRMKCKLRIVMLCGSDSYLGAGRARRVLDRVANKARSRDLTVVADWRSGDKASELLKYLAAYPAHYGMVWGGHPEALKKIRLRRKDHWFNRVWPHIQCPVVVTTPRVRVLKNGKGGASGSPGGDCSGKAGGGTEKP